LIQFKRKEMYRLNFNIPKKNYNVAIKQRRTNSLKIDFQNYILKIKEISKKNF